MNEACCVMNGQQAGEWNWCNYNPAGIPVTPGSDLFLVTSTKVTDHLLIFMRYFTSKFYFLMSFLFDPI